MITAKADDRKRLVVPLARPGQVYDVQASADGAIVLTPVKKAELRRVQARLTRKAGRLVFEIPKGLEIAEDAIPRTLPR